MIPLFHEIVSGSREFSLRIFLPASLSAEMGFPIKRSENTVFPKGHRIFRSPEGQCSRTVKKSAAEMEIGEKFYPQKMLIISKAYGESRKRRENKMLLQIRRKEIKIVDGKSGIGVISNGGNAHSATFR